MSVKVTSQQELHPALGTMKIARLSEAAGVSKSTIHNYVRSGLLPPPLKTGPTQHLYTHVHLERLRRIRRLREHEHMPLDEIFHTLSVEEESNAKEKFSFSGAVENELSWNGEWNPDKGQQIIDKSIQLFNLHGYESVRISDITDALNLGKGTFYLYFKNKNDLLIACFERLAELIVTLEQNEMVLENTDIFTRHNPRFAGFQQRYNKFHGILLLIRAASWSDDEEIRKRSRESYAAIIDPLRKDLEIAIQEGTAEPLDAELAVYALIGMADNLCYRGLIDDNYDEATIASFMHTAMLRLIIRQTNIDLNYEAIPVRAHLTAKSGSTTEVVNIKVNNESNLPISMGEAQINVPFERMDSFKILFADNKYTVNIKMKSGKTDIFSIHDDTQLSGETPFGSFRISLIDIDNVIFNA